MVVLLREGEGEVWRVFIIVCRMLVSFFVFILFSSVGK